MPELSAIGPSRYRAQSEIVSTVCLHVRYCYVCSCVSPHGGLVKSYDMAVHERSGNIDLRLVDLHLPFSNFFAYELGELVRCRPHENASAPNGPRRSRNCCWVTALRIADARIWTTPPGVPLGASTPSHNDWSNSGKPNSAMDGTFGKAGDLCVVVTPKAFTCPVSRRLVTPVVYVMSTKPPSMSRTTLAAPVYGTCRKRVPERALRSSLARCAEEPGPRLALVNFRFLAHHVQHLAESVRWKIRPRDKDLRGNRYKGYGHEIVHRIIGKRLLQRRVDGEIGDAAKEQSVAVGCQFSGPSRCNHLRAAGHVFDYKCAFQIPARESVRDRESRSPGPPAG